MGRRSFFEERKLKRIINIFGISLIISIIAFIFVFVLYDKKLKEEAQSQLIEIEKISDVVPNDDLKPASSTSDKNISEAKNTTKNTIAINTSKVTKKNVVSKTPVDSTVKKTENNVVANNIVKEEVKEEQKKELEFMAPVSGEIIKDFANDTLIYSNTLEEWTTHFGIDIKANKTTVVAASEKGTVESIKTDPRYGLTVTLSHDDGFKTIYSNLLTTEFVTEGEIVEKGQTIATVGESSSFEIADESHLHFEMYKDGKQVNPTIYLKDK